MKIKKLHVHTTLIVFDNPPMDQHSMNFMIKKPQSCLSQFFYKLFTRCGVTNISYYNYNQYKQNCGLQDK